MTEPTLRIIPLGGLGEIGRNSMVIECGDQLLVIDAGLMFPRSDMLGVDIVIADYSYLADKADRVQGIVITHGHEDHTGGLPYLLRHVRAPIYATELTLGLIQVKLREHKLLEGADLRTLMPGQPVSLGCFTIEPYHVCHSIPDGIGLGIQTPVGLIVHSGDFKFDRRPVDGWHTDFDKLDELGRRNPLVLLSDSTNAECGGFTPSEQTVSQFFDEAFLQAPGRVIVATFASNISRIRQVFVAAERAGRRVAIIGHSMINNVKMAIALGYLPEPASPVLTIEEAERLKPERVAMVCTGSQGEPTSALVRMANGGYRQVSIRAGDTVIISATPIPGNEELINQVVDNLFRLGANVYYHELTDVHVSGHASREELMQLLRVIRPRFFVPIHGEYRHLVLHGRLAQEAGVPAERIFVAESGEVLEFQAEVGRRAGRVAKGYVYVDGLGVGDISEELLRDRYALSQDGVLIVSVVLDEAAGGLLLGPHIATRGFMRLDSSNGLLTELRELIGAAVAPHTTVPGASTAIRETLGAFLYARTHRRPMILPIVMKL